jgi:hypothetical protein
MKALSNFDIIKICKDMGLPLEGILMRDEIKKNIKHGYSIINLNTSKEDGSHWTCVLYTPLKSYYFDSFGFVAPEELDEVIKPYEYNDRDIQDFNSEACGHYCIAFIKFLHNKKDKDDAYRAFNRLFKNNRKENDKILMNYLCNLSHKF